MGGIILRALHLKLHGERGPQLTLFVTHPPARLPTRAGG